MNTNSGSGNYGFQTTVNSNAAKRVLPGGSDPNNANDDTNREWLNAYNAPHWVNVYEAKGIATNVKGDVSTNGHLIDGTSYTMEQFATSWTYDLIQAWEATKTQLVAQGLIAANTQLRLNGLSDPTHLGGHASGGHSVGMGIDLGVSGYIARPIQEDDNNNGIVSPAITGSGAWSVQEALTLSAAPNLPNAQGNRQQEALRNFLSLYAVTQTDGTWNNLSIQNGAALRSALFGSGSQNNTQLIQNVWIGSRTYTDSNGNIHDDNPYTAMNAVLQALGFVGGANGLGLHHGQQPAHHNHFHVDLRAPQRVALPQNLSTDASLSQADLLLETAERLDYAKVLLEQTREDLEIKSGEVIMLIADMPNFPPQEVPVLIAQADQVQAAGDKSMRTIGVCHPAPSTAYSISNLLSPLSQAGYYLRKFEGMQIQSIGSVSVLEQPAHGALRLLDQTDVGTILLEGGDPVDPAAALHLYLPEKNYFGKDKAVFLVDIGGYQVKVVYFFQAVDGGGNGYIEDEWEDMYCKETRYRWKISLNVETGDSSITAIDYQSALVSEDNDTSTLSVDGFSAWINTLKLDGYLANDIEVALGALATGVTGQTFDDTITLDNNANGYGWYVDLTPGLNEEFLPTANPYEWKAAPGSEAEGKIDLLTVLLHEAAHTLGHDHTSDSHALMAATLEPGVRRLPSPELLAELQGLADEHAAENGNNDPSMPNPLPLAGFSVFWLGRTRKGEYGSILEAVGIKNERDIQYAVTPNPTLLNPEFASVDGWNITGDAVLGGNAAVLRESSQSQTRLNQLFTLNEGDRFLRFTLDGINLDDINAAPDDAFEVALIDANTNTNQSLLSGNGLSRSDAAINLQANGTEHLATEVTATHNSDGSRTYVLDLSNIAAGTVVSLSFDLLGFGRNEAATNSQVTVRDLKLGIPETHDDLVTTAEDIPLTINALANDLDADQPGFEPVIVTGPAHGQLVINSDGSFDYAPDENWSGDDSFTYLLSDGRVDSNTATVSVTVTPVNDAPVAADAQVTTLEDQSLLIDLVAYGSDIDSAQLTSYIVTHPTNGTLSDNGDGTFTYTPSANFNGVDSFTYLINDGELNSNTATVTIGVTSVNDAPIGADNTVVTLEDTTYIFQVADFGFSDVNDSPANNFANVIIDSLPMAGSLSLNGTAVVAGQSVSVTDIIAGLLTFAPVTNANGASYAAFTFRVQDDDGVANGGIDTDLVSRTLTIDVTSVNDAPNGADNTVVTLEDTTYTFQVADFGFSDINDSPANNFANVIIDSLPMAGSLTLNGAAVVAGQSVAVSNIAAGLLTFAPSLNDNGAAYAAFTFRVQDDDGVANGGVDTDLTSRTMTIDVTSVNDAPSGADNTVVTLEDTTYIFQVADFGFSDVNDSPANNFANVIIDSLPMAGSLTLNGATVAVGQSVSVSDITAGLLSFAPSLNDNGAGYAAFTFRVQDDDGVANGGIDTDITSRTMTIDVTSVNDAPSGADDTVVTLEDTTYIFQVADFGFSDVNDSPANNFANVIIDSLPMAGSLTLNGAAVAVGQSVAVSDIIAGLLSFAPSLNDNGAGYANFAFRVQDDDGTANGGVDTDPTARTLTIDVTSVNDAPSGADNTVVTLEDTPYVFQVADFGFSDIHDGNNFLNVIIDSLPVNGSLSLNGVAVAVGQSVAVSNIIAGLLSFAPVANANGTSYANFAFRVQDDDGTANGGIDTDPTARTLTIDVTSVNDAPTGADNTVVTLEDTTYIFQVADFGFSDVHDGNNFLNVIIDSLPSVGSLSLNGTAVIAGQSVAVSDIVAGLLSFVPSLNDNGDGYANFAFRVQDDDGTANGGVDTDPTARTLTIDVTSVNDAPTGADNTVVTLEDTPYVFQVADFGFSDVHDGNNFLNVIIDSLPVNGSLSLNGVEVAVGQSVAVSNIIAGLLTFTPVANANGTSYVNFAFRVQDDDGTANGGIDTDLVSRTLTIDVTAVNDAPVVVDAAQSVLEDDSIIIDLRNSASDVDNDVATLIGQIVAAPLYGQLSLNADGTFTYTPNINFNGVDSFTYTVNDGELDSNVATVTISVTSVNDAPSGADNTVVTLEDMPYTFLVDDFGFSDVNDTPANNFANVIVDILPEAGALTLGGMAVMAGQSITVADIAAGLLQFAPAADANGVGYAHFAFRVQDDDSTANGGIDTDLTSRTMTIDVTPVNDTPVALDSLVIGQEDTPYTFTWADFQISDIDDVQGSTNVAGGTTPGATSNGLAVVINSLPQSGLLQHFDGVSWTAVTVGQIITQADVEAGYLVFGPDANESGYDGYVTSGTGNLMADYTTFAYQGYDGELLSEQVTMTVDITPVADLPALMFVNSVNEYGATAEIVNTGWESAANRNSNSTVLPRSELEGWRAITPSGDSNNHFIVWSNGDKMMDAGNTKRKVYGAADGGNNWIELGDANGAGHETYGIEREIMTRAGMTYTLNLDYAGRLGYSSDFTRIGIYVDGAQIATYANTSSDTALNWQEVEFTFVGNGTNQVISVVSETTTTQSNGRGAMIDNLRVTELLPLSTGYQDSAINLLSVVVGLRDMDGSESLSVTVSAIPVGATLTDGAFNFTSVSEADYVDISSWDLTGLVITPPAGYTGVFDLMVSAHAEEMGTGGVSTHTLPLSVTVLTANVSSPIVFDLNGDGIQTIAMDTFGAKFDLLNSGEAIHSGWLSNEDGFLAMDSNNNGVIDSQSELFGGFIGEGYAKLKALDENQDGVIDAKDQAYEHLKVWQDRNGNRQTDSGELHSLKERDIASLSVNYSIVPEQQHGNWLLERSNATRTDGTTLAMADAYFEIPDAETANVLPTFVSLNETENDKATATINIRSLPSEVRKSLGGLFNIAPVFTRSSDELSDIHAVDNTQGMPVIEWDDDKETRKVKKERGEESSKKAKANTDWLGSFLGLSGEDKESDLSKSTGLKIKLAENDGEE